MLLASTERLYRDLPIGQLNSFPHKMLHTHVSFVGSCWCRVILCTRETVHHRSDIVQIWSNLQYTMYGIVKPECNSCTEQRWPLPCRHVLFTIQHVSRGGIEPQLQSLNVLSEAADTMNSPRGSNITACTASSCPCSCCSSSPLEVL
jgi:hypothetical protein